LELEKMINWKTLIVGTSLFITLPLSAYATQSHQEANQIQESSSMVHLAQRIKHGKRDNRGQNMDQLLQKLNLSSEQSEQIKTIRQQSETAGENIEQQMRSQHEQMKSLLASNADTEQIRAQYQKTQELHQEAGNNRFETMLRIREVLTSEQRAEIAELMEQNRSRNFEQ
jgi:periplasmic protein CpxP/Spy